MTKKLFAILAALAAAAFLGFGAPGARAACDTGTSQVRDADGNPTGEDTVTTTPNGSTVYAGEDADAAAAGGYVGVTGGTGFIELSGSDGDATLQGATNDGAVSGSVSGDGICLNDTTAP